MIYKKEEEPVKPKKTVNKTSDNTSDVMVAGIDKIKVNLANCCNPIPGDEIIGYITKANGISVHRKSCHNLEYLDSRTVEVNWSNFTNDKYETVILIHTNTSDNKLMEVMQKLSMFDIHVDRFMTLREGENNALEITLYVKNLEYLTKVCAELEKLPYVSSIERLMR